MFTSTVSWPIRYTLLSAMSWNRREKKWMLLLATSAKPSFEKRELIWVKDARFGQVGVAGVSAEQQ